MGVSSAPFRKAWFIGIILLIINIAFSRPLISQEGAVPDIGGAAWMGARANNAGLAPLSSVPLQGGMPVAGPNNALTLQDILSGLPKLLTNPAMNLSGPQRTRIAYLIKEIREYVRAINRIHKDMRAILTQSQLNYIESQRYRGTSGLVIERIGEVGVSQKADPIISAAITELHSLARETPAPKNSLQQETKEKAGPK